VSGKIKWENADIVCCGAPGAPKLLSAEHSQRHRFGVHRGLYAVFMSHNNQSIYV
jgi:hypothetical protein